MGYKEDNARIIDEAFAKFQANAEASFRSGLEAVLDKGVEFCLEHHKDTDPEHPTPHLHHVEEGGYGWILIHNGAEVNRKLFGDNPAFVNEANEQLNNVRSKAPNTGWVGIVMASLRESFYFDVLYEFIPMRAAIRDLKSGKDLDYDAIFKPMNV